MNCARIAAMAAAVPKEKVDLLDLGFDTDTMKRTMRLTGCHSVRYAPSDRTALDYCLAAAKKIFESTSFDPKSIDGIVFATPRPDYLNPGNCGIIQSELGIPTNCIATDIRHACTGLIYGIYLADRLIYAGDCQNVLVCCGDTASHHTNIKDRALRMVVGDGGVAALISLGGTRRSEYSFCHQGSGLKHLYMPAGGERMPIKLGFTDQETTDADGNTRTAEDDFMDGMEVMRFVMGEIPPLVNNVLKKSDWNKNEVSVFAFHQANSFIVKSLARHMKLDKTKVLDDIDGNGNIGGGSIALALCHANEKKHEPWSKVVMAGFGSGMSGAAMSADLSETVILPTLEI